MSAASRCRATQFRREREALVAASSSGSLAARRAARTPRRCAGDGAGAAARALPRRRSRRSASRARSRSTGTLVEYLEALCARALLRASTASRRPLAARRGEFFGAALPARPCGASAGRVAARRGAVLSSAAVVGLRADRARPRALLRVRRASGWRRGATRPPRPRSLRDGLYDGGERASELAAFASFLFTHNAARRDPRASRSGSRAGVPTFVLLFVERPHARARSRALYASPRPRRRLLGLGPARTASPSSSAVVLCGAAGLLVGAGASSSPGAATRLENLARARARGGRPRGRRGRAAAPRAGSSRASSARRSIDPDARTRSPSRALSACSPGSCLAGRGDAREPPRRPRARRCAAPARRRARSARGAADAMLGRAPA